jgi:hypothetical protein
MRRDDFLALGGYSVLTLLLFLPILPLYAQAIPGGPVAVVDGWYHVWHLWWAWQALSTGQSPFFTPLLYHPSGVDLSVHPLNLSNGLMVLPVTALAGPTAAYNLAAMLSFIIGGWAAYRLGRMVGGSAPVAFAAGLIFAFSPYHLTKLWDGQMELIAVQWLAGLAICLLSIAMVGSWRFTLLAGLMLAIIGYTSLYYLIFAAVFAVAFTLFWLPYKAGRQAIMAYLVRFALVPLVAIVLLLPLLVPLSINFQAIASGGAEDLVRGDFLPLRSANLFDFFLPSALHPWWGTAVEQVGKQLHPGISAWNSALGYTALVLAGCGVVLAWQKAWRWLGLLVVTLVLALGPILQIGTVDTGIPLPYQLLSQIPGMGLARRPSHFVVLATIALVPLATLGLQALGERLRRPHLLVGLAAVLLIFEYLPRPLPPIPLTVHPIYGQLASSPGALMVVPEVNKDTFSLQRQLLHKRPIVGGFLARTPENPFVAYTPGVRQLWRLQPEPAAVTEPPDVLGPLALRSANITQFVVDRAWVTPEQQAAAEAAISQVLPGLQPSYSDEAVLVYDLPAVSLRPFAYFGSGWDREEQDGTRSWRWMGAEGEIVLVNPLAEPAVVSLLLRGESYLRPRNASLLLDGHPVGEWQAAGSVVLRFLLTPGEHRLVLRAPAEAEEGRSGRLLSVLLSEMRVEE